MSAWLLAVVAGVVVALTQYGLRELRTGGAFTVVAALLRAAVVSLIVALLLDAPLGFAAPASAWVALDVSSSMVRDDSTTWRAARDSLTRAQRAGGGAAESVFVFGDSIRRGSDAGTPSDPTTRLRPVVERALGAGHPLLIITDGEIDDPDAAASLPAGSRLVVLKHPPRRDLGVVSIDAPRALVSGDTVEVRVTLAAGGGGAAPGSLSLTLNDRPIATAPVDSMAPFAERTVSVKARLQGASGSTLLKAAVSSPGDSNAHDDTLSVAVDLSRAASAVFVSTSPDFDARYALSVLRGSLGIPSRGFFRVAPGEWRADGSLAPASEADVRQALHDAPVAIIHGDTAIFGPPRAATAGPLALLVTTGTEGEWYPSAAPLSPLAPSLSGVVWDSLPPVGLSPNVPKGSWVGVEARRGRGDERRPVVVGMEEPRRVAVIAASGLWRWKFRGGVSGDAFTAVWGSVFDWLAAERADHRAAVPDERVVRAGDPVRWRRGSAADSLVTVVVQQHGAPRGDTLTLRFPPGVSVTQTPPLAAGVYDVTTRGGSVLLPVNPSREWLPRSPTVKAGEQTRSTLSADAAPRIRGAGWAYALAILLVCVEWVLRRRRGMR
ncbi:MAG TPA: hypothetical protein VGQ44_12820 [Gemmatimonadaceae bacterium]|nr:hypothetical protein [Gemmatimonadaceae bacterium]